MTLWLALNFVDVILTLLALNAGALELNPFMGWFIKQNVWLFITAKMGLSALALWWLMRHPDALLLGNKAMLAIIGINAVSLMVMI